MIDITRIASPQLHAIDIGARGLRIGALAAMRAVKLAMDPVELRLINDTDKNWVTGKPYRAAAG